MTVPPLPDTPCVRVAVDYNVGSAGEGGSRFFLSYSGSAPTAANCVTLAGDVATAWAAHLAALIPVNYSLGEVDVIDIATHDGASGQWTGADSGSRSGSYLPASVCTNIEFRIARRYRGGKPRMFHPPGVQADLVDQTHWSASYVGAVNSGIEAFFTAVEDLTVGSMGTLQHVNLSYYKGFTNLTNSSGRERAVPTYRATAISDPVTGYATKAIVGSQRRRRTATSP